MYYVAMTDRQASGQGDAYKKLFKLVVECQDKAQAELVAKNARRNPVMQHVSVQPSKPVWSKSMHHTQYIPFAVLGANWTKE